MRYIEPRAEQNRTEPNRRNSVRFGLEFFKTPVSSVFGYNRTNRSGFVKQNFGLTEITEVLNIYIF